MRHMLVSCLVCVVGVSIAQAQTLRLALDPVQTAEALAKPKSSPTAPASLAPPRPTLPPDGGGEGRVRGSGNLANPLPPVPTNLPKFDPRHIELRRVDNHWQIMAGRAMLKDFGLKETEARAVLRLIRELGLTQLGTIGEPRPIMEYWLTNGQAPQGLCSGVQFMPIDTASLKVERVADDWFLLDRHRIYFNFGTRENEADLALAVIRHYGFTRVGYVGQGTPVMNLFLGSPTTYYASDESQSKKKEAANATSRTQDARFAGKSSPDPHPTNLVGGQSGVMASNGFNQAPPGDRTPFDWRRVAVKHEKEEWKLMAGSHVLANFEGNERDARLALAAVQHYRFTEHYTIGQPAPGLTYFLIGGQPPRSLMFGLEQSEIKLSDVKAKHDPNGWIVTDGQQLHLHFATEADAKTAAAIIQRHKFDHILHLGPHDGNGLTFYARTK